MINLPESSPGPLTPNPHQERIEGGFILLARKMTKNSIMEKPPLYIKVWVWMLLQASYTDHGNLKRGQFFTSLEKMREAITYKVGYRTVRPSVKEIRSAYDFLTKGNMIGIAKVTHGMVITILNYTRYQDWMNYEGHNEGHDEGPSEGTIYNKEGNKEGNKRPLRDSSSEISLLKKRYPHTEIINQAFDAIRSTRKSGEVSDSVLLAQLRKWARYPAEQVEAGIKAYLQKDYASQGKKEEYLLGIIRNQKTATQDKPVSTGSPLLDAYYAKGVTQ